MVFAHQSNYAVLIVVETLLRHCRKGHALKSIACKQVGIFVERLAHTGSATLLEEIL